MSSASAKNGDKGERRVVSLLASKGYWATVLQRSRTGSQPFDIVAIRKDGVRGNDVLMLDAKYVEKGYRFAFDDIQPNQIESMSFSSDITNATIGFAIVFGEIEDRIMFFPYDDYIRMKDVARSVNASSLEHLELFLGGNE